MAREDISVGGEYRQVNISKDGFVFAMAAQVPRLMSEFERKELARFTPCTFDNLENVLEALAITHCELVLIHPFREGKRTFVTFALPAYGIAGGAAAVEFFQHQGKQREAYFAAVRAGMGRDYAPMVEIFRKVVKASS